MRALRGVAALTLTGVALAAAYAGLRALGFQPRWEVAAPAARPPPEVARRMPPPVSPTGTVPAAPGTGAEEAAAFPAGARGDSAFPAGGPVANYPPARIDFETYADGRPVQPNAAVAAEWRDQGLALSFESYTAEATRPYVLDASGYLPPGARSHALGPALSGERGLEVGVIHLDFAGRPRRVAFTLLGPDLVERFEVIVWSRGERLPATVAAHAPDTRYATGEDEAPGPTTYNPGGRGVFRAERVVVDVAAGIERISLDGWGPPGHLLLVEDLAIDP